MHAASTMGGLACSIDCVGHAAGLCRRCTHVLQSHGIMRPVSWLYVSEEGGVGSWQTIPHAILTSLVSHSCISSEKGKG